MVKLICFPYAGSSSFAYARWRERLPAWIDVVAVELPGRGRLHAKPLQTRMADLLPLLRRELTVDYQRPFALFGHSLGASIAFEFAYQLEREIGVSPVVVFASAAHAPSSDERRRFVHLMSDIELIAELKRLNGTPPEVLASPELLELVLPVLRADFQLAAGYQRSQASISGPLHVLAGDDDSLKPADLQVWHRHTQGPFQIDTFPGGHFYIQEQEAALLQLIARRLASLLASGTDLPRSARELATNVI